MEVTDDNRDASHSAKAKAMDAISEGKYSQLTIYLLIFICLSLYYAESL